MSPLSIEATISETRCIAVSRVGGFFSVLVGMVGRRLVARTTPQIAAWRNPAVGVIFREADKSEDWVALGPFMD
jgi:hypothetical protein